jgi:hypothetical protein
MVDILGGTSRNFRYRLVWMMVSVTSPVTITIRFDRDI